MLDVPKNIKIMASELAKEIVQMSQRQDRTSPLVLIVYSRSTRSRDIRNEQETMRITAPIEGGKLIFRISFPIQNYTPILGNNVHDNNQLADQTILDYDADNIEGAATCIEGYMSYRDKRDVMLFQVIHNGDLGQFPLSRWTLEENQSGKTGSRVQTLQKILNVLLVKS
mmetsp:Transcript_18461/g.31220  ORF Transcript_18461/g.31220 Transcript_18461/m.31220 type:complete len:169 (-) Transcript_18461:591-1097(-)